MDSNFRFLKALISSSKYIFENPESQKLINEEATCMLNEIVSLANKYDMNLIENTALRFSTKKYFILFLNSVSDRFTVVQIKEGFFKIEDSEDFIKEAKAVSDFARELDLIFDIHGIRGNKNV